jgi:HTH-type transcriptional regulator/antitoxin HigA
MDLRDAKAETEEEDQVMTNAAIRDIEVLMPTWRELESQTHVKLRAIESERHYRSMVGFMNDLLDIVGDQESHPLMGLLDVVTGIRA